MIIFSEDSLLEEIGRRIIKEMNPKIQVTSVMGKKGFGYFQKRLNNIVRASSAVQFFILLDSDCLGKDCIPKYIFNTFGCYKPNNIFIRFAVEEAENWLLADWKGLCSFLKVSHAKLKIPNDEIANAKEFIINLSKYSKDKNIRGDMVPEKNYSSAIGPAYNDRLCEFVRDTWDVSTARKFSKSLDRACLEISSI